MQSMYSEHREATVGQAPFHFLPANPAGPNPSGNQEPAIDHVHQVTHTDRAVDLEGDCLPDQSQHDSIHPTWSAAQ
jgi:hypothetical protein